MNSVDFEKLVYELVKPLTAFPEDIVVKTFSDDDNVISLHVVVHKDDLGRVIGKQGRVANAIRTIAYAAAARQQKRLQIEIESFE
jgi:predicted RNA-binding protein YlqC (UPF0109 family)